MATYYVAKTGSNGNPGTEALPKLTITAGVGLLTAPGDVLEVKGGTYVETLTIDSGVANGTASARTTIKSFGTDDVIIRPTSFISGSGALVRFIDTRNYFTIQGSLGHRLVIDGINMTTTDAGALQIMEPCHNITCEYVEVKNSTGQGISGVYHTLPALHHITVRNCYVHDCGRGRTGAITIHGIYFGGADTLVEDCLVHDQDGGYGIHLYNQGTAAGSVDRAVVRRNRIYNIERHGILIGSGDNNLAYNNLVYDCTYGVQVSFGNGANNQVYNNTLYNNSAQAVDINSGMTGTIVRNNIFWANGINGVDNNGTGTIQSNNLTSNPLFVNAATSDFHLQAGSPAINFGTNLSSLFTTDYDGATRPASGAWEAGAYEFGVDTTPPAAPTGLQVT